MWVDSAERVLAGAVDLGFVETPDRPERVEYVQIGEDEIVAVAAPGTELAALSAVTPESLATSTLLLREHGSGTRAAAVRWLEQLAASPREELALSSTGSLKCAAEAGLGFAMISRFAVERELAAGSLVELPLPRTCARRPLGAVMRDRSTCRRRRSCCSRSRRRGRGAGGRGAEVSPPSRSHLGTGALSAPRSTIARDHACLQTARSSSHGRGMSGWI